MRLKNNSFRDSYEWFLLLEKKIPVCVTSFKQKLGISWERIRNLQRAASGFPARIRGGFRKEIFLVTKEYSRLLLRLLKKMGIEAVQGAVGGFKRGMRLDQLDRPLPDILAHQCGVALGIQ